MRVFHARRLAVCRDDIALYNDDGDAPKCFRLKENKNLLTALGLTFAGLIVSIILSLVLPKNIYEHMTTAAVLMLLYTWLFILFSGKKLLETTKMGTAQIVIALVLIVACLRDAV